MGGHIGGKQGPCRLSATATTQLFAISNKHIHRYSDLVVAIKDDLEHPDAIETETCVVGDLLNG